jgi:hypothetical protein
MLNGEVVMKIADYLQDKFPDHKLSDYQEASAYLTYLMNIEIIDQMNRQMKMQMTKRL